MKTVNPYTRAARKYAPDSKRWILFVAEAPPADIDRYFYFEDVQSDDWLWIALMKALYSSDWGATKIERRRKRGWLERFQKSGYQLIDSVKQPIERHVSDSQRVDLIDAAAPELVAEIKQIDPKQVVLIKSTVHEALFRKLKDGGVPVVNSFPLPFPCSGRQAEFAKRFRKLIDDGYLCLSTLRISR